MADKERNPDAPDLKESDAEAPGPISPEHESGSWEQTLEEQKAREKVDEARESKSAKPAASKPSGSSSSGSKSSS